VPSTSFVREPLRPVLCFVTPVKIVPETVATIESLIASVTSPEDPPPVRPVPALTAVMSPTVPSFVIVIAPEEPVVIEIPLPAMRYDVPSVNFVNEPLRPCENFVWPETPKAPEANVSPLKTMDGLSAPEAVELPETKKVTVGFGKEGKDEPGWFANMTLPVIPILEELLADPEILFAIKAIVHPSDLS
jgi:hypothetical protein